MFLGVDLLRHFCGVIFRITFVTKRSSKSRLANGCRLFSRLFNILAALKTTRKIKTRKNSTIANIFANLLLPHLSRSYPNGLWTQNELIIENDFLLYLLVEKSDRERMSILGQPIRAPCSPKRKKIKYPSL